MHFAGVGDWSKWAYFHIYDKLSFDQIKRNQFFKVNLDIIILTYKNKALLRKTLNSISKVIRSFVNIIVINNGDTDDYNDILSEYPYIQYHFIQSQISWGAARNYALKHSNGSYITFMDAGNTFIPGSDKVILNTIRNSIFFDMYHWDYRPKSKDKRDYDTLLGYVFRREFLEGRNILFTDTNDYEGFIRACRLILDYYAASKIVRFYISKVVMFKEENNFEIITPMSKAINIISAIRTTVHGNVSPYHILLTCANCMLQLYYQFIKAYQEEPECMFECWDAAKYFFDNCYDIYKQVGTRGAMLLYNKIYLKKIIKEIKWNYPLSLNFKTFLRELNEYTTLPEHYLIGG